MLITVRDAISISLEQGCDIEIKRKRSWRKCGEKRGIRIMDGCNFNLNSVFQDNAKEYTTRPVMAMKYQPGVENGWMAYYENKPVEGKNHKIYFGIRFFPTKGEAQKFIDANEKQYAIENGVPIEMEAEYDVPLPVLYSKDFDQDKKGGLSFGIEGGCPFNSNESEKYEFEILENESWIIRDMDGSIRVWNPDMDVTFFGRDRNIVFEKVAGEYIKIEL